jgi:spondin N
MVATQGIQDMAERGRTSPLDQEIEAAIRGGSADRVWIGSGISPSPGTTSLEFEISQRYPLATFVSMIAPSPDWFVGVSSLALFQDGQWVNERRVDLIPWDAGTDSGTTFTSPDRDTQPRIGISRILGAPLAPAGSARPLGTFTFTRLVNWARRDSSAP